MHNSVHYPQDEPCGKSNNVRMPVVVDFSGNRLRVLHPTHFLQQPGVFSCSNSDNVYKYWAICELPGTTVKSFQTESAYPCLVYQQSRLAGNLPYRALHLRLEQFLNTQHGLRCGGGLQAMGSLKLSKRNSLTYLFVNKSPAGYEDSRNNEHDSQHLMSVNSAFKDLCLFVIILLSSLGEIYYKLASRMGYDALMRKGTKGCAVLHLVHPSFVTVTVKCNCCFVTRFGIVCDQDYTGRFQLCSWISNRSSFFSANLREDTKNQLNRKDKFILRCKDAQNQSVCKNTRKNVTSNFLFIQNKDESVNYLLLRHINYIQTFFYLENKLTILVSTRLIRGTKYIDHSDEANQNWLIMRHIGDTKASIEDREKRSSKDKGEACRCNVNLDLKDVCGCDANKPVCESTGALELAESQHIAALNLIKAELKLRHSRMSQPERKVKSGSPQPPKECTNQCLTRDHNVDGVREDTTSMEELRTNELNTSEVRYRRVAGSGTHYSAKPTTSSNLWGSSRKAKVTLANKDDNDDIYGADDDDDDDDDEDSEEGGNTKTQEKLRLRASIKLMNLILTIWHILFIILCLFLLAGGILLKHYFYAIIEKSVMESHSYVLYEQFVRIETLPDNPQFGELTNVLGMSLIILSSIYMLCVFCYLTIMCHKVIFMLPLMIITTAVIVLTEVNIINIYMSPLSSANEEAKKDLKHRAVTEYVVNDINDFSVTYDLVSIWFSCCGIVDQYDFQNAHLVNTFPNRETAKPFQVPPTCCMPSYFEKGFDFVEDCATRAEGIYSTGCYQKFFVWLRGYCDLFSSVIVTQLLDVLFHIVLYRKHLTLLRLEL